MVKPYSEDLRWRVVGRVVSGETVRDVATMFDVSVASGRGRVRLPRRVYQLGAPRPLGIGITMKLRRWMGCLGSLSRHIHSSRDRSYGSCTRA